MVLLIGQSMLIGLSWFVFSVFTLLATLLYYAGVLYYFQKYKASDSTSNLDKLVQSQDLNELAATRRYFEQNPPKQSNTSDPASFA